MRPRLLMIYVSLLCVAFSAIAETKTSFEVNITEAGTLENAIKALNTESIKKLTVVGKLNGTDIKYLRSEEVRNYEMDSLDLYDVTLVAGGDSYYTYVNPGGDGDYFSSGTYYVYLSDKEAIEFVDASYVMGVQSKYRWYSNALPYAFASTNIKYVTLPKSLKTIGQGIFDRSNVEEVVLPSDVTDVGPDAFFACSSLKKISSLSEIKTIGNRAFSQCKLLSFDLLDISNTLTIGDEAFNYCKKIKAAKFSDDLYSVGSYAFSSCSSLTSISYNPNAATLYSTSSFDDSWISNLPVENGIIYMGKTAIRPVYDYMDEILPELKFRDGTLAIAHNFAKQVFYSKVIFPESLKRIGNKAFINGGGGWRGDYYIGIESLELPSGLVEIGASAFGSVEGIKELTIPESVEKIGEGAFASCIGLKELYYYGCGGNSIFACCSGLESAVIGNNLHRFGNRFFYGCQNLKNVDFLKRPSDSKLTIGDESFSNCSSLQKIYLPEGTDSIGQSAFNGCSAMDSVYLPKSLSFIGYSAFSGGNNLRAVTIPENVTWQKTYIARGGDKREAKSFFSSTHLKTITILSKDAGYWKNMDSLQIVYLGAGIETVREEAFYNCKRLKDVYCYAMKVPEAVENSFVKSVIAKDTLHVFKQMMEDYKSTVPWSYFGWIIPIDGDSTPDDPIVSDSQEAYFEYFIDVDPGYGKANKVKEISAENNELEFDLGSVMPGAHMLYVRSIDEQGRWSTTISRPLYVRQPVSVIALEYFFDGADPGLGKAIPVVLPRDSKDEFSFEVAIKGLTAGDHQICLRSKNSDGIWSIVSKEQFSLTEETGIDVIDAERSPSITYTLKGYRSNGQKGINIVHYKDGTTQKVIIK